VIRFSAQKTLFHFSSFALSREREGRILFAQPAGPLEERERDAGAVREQNNGKEERFGLSKKNSTENHTLPLLLLLSPCAHSWCTNRKTAFSNEIIITKHATTHSALRMRFANNRTYFTSQLFLGKSAKIPFVTKIYHRNFCRFLFVGFFIRQQYCQLEKSACISTIYLVQSFLGSF
jgi:hypothetical protein